IAALSEFRIDACIEASLRDLRCCDAQAVHRLGQIAADEVAEDSSGDQKYREIVYGHADQHSVSVSVVCDHAEQNQGDAAERQQKPEEDGYEESSHRTACLAGHA